MSTTDHDIPTSPHSGTKREAASEDCSDAKKVRVDWGAFSGRIKGAGNWITSLDKSTFKDVTNKETGRRTLLVLNAPAGVATPEQFCMVGRVMDARLSSDALTQPREFEGSDKHTDLELHLSMRDSDSEVQTWPSFNSDVTESVAAIDAVRDKAIDTFIPILSKSKTVNGLSPDQLKRIQKHAKTPEKLFEKLQDDWRGTGMNQNKDIVRFKRRCYNANDLSKPREFMDNWLKVMDSKGEELNYIEDPDAIRRGDVVLVWFRVLAQIAAGNFHVSLEPRSVMRLESASMGCQAEGSAGFAASMAKAMARDL